jgi:hypothetical protein
MTEDLLDQIDAVVFDEGSTDEARLQALIFALEHTQGFDDADFISAKSKIPSATAAMLKRKNSAMQLETLCEFAEHHLSDRDFTRVELLAKACIALPSPKNGNFEEFVLIPYYKTLVLVAGQSLCISGQ